jgi:methylglutaconyl-CoA hydratase
MPDELVHLDVAGGVGTITLDSPENRNALSRRLIADLDRQLTAVLADPAVRVIVLTGTGSAFCSGADLKERRAWEGLGSSRPATSPSPRRARRSPSARFASA